MHNRGELSRSQTDQFMKCMERHGGDAEHADFSLQHPWLHYDFWRSVRREKGQALLSREDELRRLLLEGNGKRRFFGTFDAYVHFARKTDCGLMREGCDAPIRMLQSMPENLRQTKFLVWIPRISTKDIVSLLPDSFFPTFGHKPMQANSDAWLTKPVQAGFRLIDRFATSAEHLAECFRQGYDCLHPVEAHYVQLVQWLVCGDRQYNVDRLYCQSEDRQHAFSVQFLGWAKDKRDTLGIRLEEILNSASDETAVRILCRRFV